MKIQFDVDKSIERRQIIPVNRNFWEKLDDFYFYIGSFFIGSVCSIVAIGFARSMILRAEIDLLPVVLFIVLPAFLGFLCLFAFVNQNKLSRVSGSDFENNFKAIVAILKEKFEIEVNPTPREVIKAYKHHSSWKAGIRVIVIFKNDDIYLNIARFNHRDLESPFHPFFDYLKIRSIKRDFEFFLPNH